jgi:superoxide dismutase
MQFGWGGGMEHATMTSMGGWSRSLIAHELAHQWFGDLVTCESWSHLVLNEGFATYGEQLWLEHKLGKDAALQKSYNTINRYLNYAKNNSDDAIINFNYKDKEDMFNTITYQKGSRVLHLLRSILGDDAFFEAVKNYLSKHAFSNAEIDDLRKEFEQVSKDRFGSGWAWLILTKTNKLKIISTPNQDNPLMLSNKEGGYPILGLDLWEHAYYLKYQNKRDEYIQNFWDVVNWKFVNDLFEMKSKTKLKENLILKNVLKETNFNDTKESIRFIFNMNPKVKSIFKESINSIFENVITENYSNKSFINKLQTNPLAFSVLLEHTNNLLEKENKEKIEIIGVPINKQINETIRFVLFLENNKSRFFNTNSSVFKKLLSIIESYNQKI